MHKIILMQLIQKGILLVLFTAGGSAFTYLEHYLRKTRAIACSFCEFYGPPSNHQMLGRLDRSSINPAFALSETLIIAAGQMKNLD